MGLAHVALAWRQVATTVADDRGPARGNKSQKRGAPAGTRTRDHQHPRMEPDHWVGLLFVLDLGGVVVLSWTPRNNRKLNRSSVLNFADDGDRSASSTGVRRPCTWGCGETEEEDWVVLTGGLASTRRRKRSRRRRT